MQSAANERWTRTTATSPTSSSAATPRPAGKTKARPSPGDETFHVFGSGNLGLIYVRGEKRAAHASRRCPPASRRSSTGLAAHPGVGFVVVMDDDGPVALGNRGWHRLDDGHVDGVDPAAAVRTATHPSS